MILNLVKKRNKYQRGRYRKSVRCQFINRSKSELRNEIEKPRYLSIQQDKMNIEDFNDIIIEAIMATSKNTQENN